ncbi:Hsp20/alpha crystallin family protein [Haloparvum alkalitolerans]|uniref:archaeal heat shock protein Hsp14 n=1 Tax=Haloparvum alkalitolerans TaxID=1042953 RepID=UPI003CF3F539
MTRRDPFRDIEELFDRMSREFEEFGSGIESRVGEGISVDVAEDDETVTVTADLPGYDRDDVEVTVQDRTLTIAAEHAETDEADDEDTQYHRRERRRRSVSRRLRLPTEVREDEASATYQHGVLTVELPKATGDAGGHSIDID